MIRYHLYISLSPHLYLTSKQKLKYSPKKMKPSVADRKSGKRVYLNRYLLMEEDSGCVYLEYARDDRPESLYTFLYRAFASKESEQKLLSGMPDVLVLPKGQQKEELISLLQAYFIQLEAPPPGFRSGSSIFRQVNLFEENFEDDGLWVAPSTIWPPDLEYVNQKMQFWISSSYNGMPKSGERVKRYDRFCQEHPSLHFPGDKEAFFAQLWRHTREEVKALEDELWAAKPKQARKTPGNKDWLKAEDVFDQGREYDWSGEPKKAMQMYRRALDIHPGYVDAHVHIGHDLASMIRYPEAEGSYRRALTLGREQLGEIDPEDAWVDLDTRPFMRALHGLGLVLARKREWQQALECFQELLRIDPQDHLGIRYLIGEVYHQLGDFHQARVWYQRAADWPEGAWNLVWLHLEEEDVPGAALTAVKALQVNTYVPTVLQRMIYIRFGPIPHFALHSFEQAISYCREQQVLMWRRIPYRYEFLEAFCSVPEIKDMLDTDQPPSLSEDEAHALAAQVVEKLNP